MPGIAIDRFSLVGEIRDREAVTREAIVIFGGRGAARIEDLEIEREITG